MNKKIIVGIFIVICVLLGIVALQSLNANSVKMTYESLEGEKINFSKLKGNVVVINFWATWCGPCLIEIPNLIELQEEFKDKSVKIFGISTDDYEEDVLEFMTHRPFNYPVIMVEQDMFKLFPVPPGIPYTILYDKDGEIADVFIGFKPIDTFREAIEALL